MSLPMKTLYRESEEFKMCEDFWNLVCFVLIFFFLGTLGNWHHILQDIYKTKKKKTGLFSRMLSISGTCKAFLEDMKIRRNIFGTMV